MTALGRFGAAACLAVALTVSSGAANATTIDFSYSGTTSVTNTFTSTGSGSFSFNATSGPVTLADLTTFNFLLSTTEVSLTNNYSFGLADLSSFSLSSGNSPSATISFQTNFISGLPGVFLQEEFGATGTLLSATGTIVSKINSGGSVTLDTGPVTFSAATAVPEPLTLSLFGAGLFGAAAMRRRKKKTA